MVCAKSQRLGDAAKRVARGRQKSKKHVIFSQVTTRNDFGCVDPGVYTPYTDRIASILISSFFKVYFLVIELSTS